nr:glutamate--tRNA ligase family protein [Saprospiraceae bacterium]
KLEIFPSKQYEFARMNVEYMITSKRKLLKLVQDKYVTGWDDPRMPTVSGMRRKGYPPMAIRNFCDKAGVAKRENTIEISLLESCVREELNKTALRTMVVLDPVKVVITNYPEGQSEKLQAENNPEDATAGHREITFGREIYIEREDFMENAPPKYFRMTPGSDVRLKHAYILHCTGVDKDENGQVTTIYAPYYSNSRSGEDVSGIKPKGTLHWVSATESKPCEVRMYDRLFTVADPTGDDDVDFLTYYNQNSLTVIPSALMESNQDTPKVGSHYQFLRHGYFCVDVDSNEDKPIFNLTVGLKDSFAKEMKK